MKYNKIVKGIFKNRPNRFVAEVIIDGKPITCHVKNTGRCKEILVPGATIYLEDFIDNMKNRKYRYSLVTAEKKTPYGDFLINIDSQAPNKVVKEALEEGFFSLPNMDQLEIIRPEKTYHNSRFDFYVKDINGKEGFLEVKGVTLEKNQKSSFPDAPTLRGVKHVEHLIKAKEDGYNAYILFLIQIENMKSFTPNYENHKEFGDIVKKAKTSGVEVLAFDCLVGKDSLVLNKEVEVIL